MFRESGRIGYEKGAASFGFTLTELAIVIGIVGVIIGAIFTAYSVTEYHILLNQGVDEVSLIAGNMRSLYAGRAASAAPAIAYGAAGEATLVGQNVFPSEMIRPSNPAVADNPWDQSAANGSAEIEVNTPTAGQFTIEYLNVPADACTDLLIRNSTPGPDTGLVQIKVVSTAGAVSHTYVYNPAAAAYQLPLSSVTAAVACPSQTAPLYDIQWTYTLGS